jgi:hypothetical protein
VLKKSEKGPLILPQRPFSFSDQIFCNVIQGKSALIFCTYSGPHTGIREAAPAGKYLGQFFEHLGFFVVDEWYVLGEFHGSEENNTMGRMGDIRGLPDEDDLRRIGSRAKVLASRLADPR